MRRLALPSVCLLLAACSTSTVVSASSTDLDAPGVWEAPPGEPFPVADVRMDRVWGIDAGPGRAVALLQTGRLIEIDPQDRTVTVLADLPITIDQALVSELRQVMDVALDASGTAWVVHAGDAPGQSRLWRIPPDGQVDEVKLTGPAAQLQLGALAADPLHGGFVAGATVWPEPELPFLVRIDPSGASQPIWTPAEETGDPQANVAAMRVGPSAVQCPVWDPGYPTFAPAVGVDDVGGVWWRDPLCRVLLYLPSEGEATAHAACLEPRDDAWYAHAARMDDPPMAVWQGHGAVVACGHAGLLRPGGSYSPVFDGDGRPLLAALHDHFEWSGRAQALALHDDRAYVVMDGNLAIVELAPPDDLPDAIVGGG